MSTYIKSKQLLPLHKYPYIFKICRPFLTCASRIFQRVVTWRHFLYDRNILRMQSLPIPVISIGNIIMGGSGKTPFVQKLMRDLSEIKKGAILSRGYGRKEKGQRRINGLNASYLTPEQVGDEPLLHARNLPSSYVYVHKDRYRSGIRAYKEGASYVVLDDGMQHRSLVRDLEIVLLHSADLFGGKAFFPLGNLRDLISRLKKADYVVIHGVKEQREYEIQKNIVQACTSAPIFGTQITEPRFFHPYGEIEIHQKTPLGAFCAIGKPEGFFSLLEKAVTRPLVFKKSFRDHFLPKERHIQNMVEQALRKGCKYVVCTEKDWVKISNGLKSRLPLLYVKTNLEVVSDQAQYQRLINSIAQLIN